MLLAYSSLSFLYDTLVSCNDTSGGLPHWQYNHGVDKWKWKKETPNSKPSETIKSWHENGKAAMIQGDHCCSWKVQLLLSKIAIEVDPQCE